MAEELDAAFLEQGALTICANSEANSGYEDAFCARSCVTCRNQFRAALATISLPAAALNALWRGEAVVVPLSPFGEQIAAALVPQLEAPDGDPTSIAVYRAMLAASPFSTKEVSNKQETSK